VGDVVSMMHLRTAPNPALRMTSDTLDDRGIRAEDAWTTIHTQADAMTERVEMPPPPPLEPTTLKSQLQRKVSGRELAIVVLQMAIGGLFGGVAMYALLKSGSRLSPPGTNPALVAVLALPLAFAALLLQILLHELGHALVGQWMGGQILRVIVGPWRWERFRSGMRRRKVRALKGVGGLAQTILPDGPQFGRAYCLMLLGGPLANLATAGATWALIPYIGPWPLKLAAGTFVVVGLLFGVVNLLPFRSGGFHTDGLQLLRSWTDPAAMDVRRRMLRLMRAGIDGLRPREYPAEDLAAFDVDRLTGLERLAAQMVHASVALDRGDHAQARAGLAPALSDWERLPDGIRQSLALTAALLSAEHDRDASAAREWLRRTEGGLLLGFERDWVEACIADLEGDAVARNAALGRLSAALDDTVYRGDERVYRDKLDAMVAAAATSRS
jgi:hypothetical protein